MPTSHGLLVILSMSVLPPEVKKPQKQTWWQIKHVKHDVYDTQQPMLPAATTVYVSATGELQN